MLLLEITPEMVGRDRTRLTLGYLESVMLWPGVDDEDRRAEAMKTATAAFIHSTISAVPAARRAVDAADWLSWSEVLRDAYPSRHFTEPAKKAFVYGIVAGELLAAAVYEPQRPLKLEALKARTYEILAKRAEVSEEFVISRSTLQILVWDRYRCVSHLWGAFFLAARGGDTTFPCRLARLPEFLHDAGALLDAGCEIALPRRRQPLLDRPSMWTVPALALPRG